MNLVAECTTMSAPSFSGCCNTLRPDGEALPPLGRWRQRGRVAGILFQPGQGDIAVDGPQQLLHRGILPGGHPAVLHRHCRFAQGAGLAPQFAVVLVGLRAERGIGIGTDGMAVLEQHRVGGQQHQAAMALLQGGGEVQTWIGMHLAEQVAEVPVSV